MTTATINTTATATESLHLKRLKEFHTRIGVHDRDTHRTCWQVFHLKPESYIEWKRTGESYEEMQVGGYQLIIVGVMWTWRKVLDLNQNPIHSTYAHDIEIGGYGDWNNETTYVAYSYRIGTDTDRIANINWGGQFATFAGTCTTNSKDKTTKLAKKKLEVYNLVLDKLGELIPLSGEWANRSDLETPYNISVGDHVWVQAFGRVRQGIVVSNVGSRFVVGYVTPTNSYDLKFKILPLSQIRIRK